MTETLRASGKLSAAIFGSRVLGLVREVVFAALFGSGAVADAYTVAFRIPNALRDLLAEGALSSAFVPTFTASLKKEGPHAAYLLGNLVLSGILVLTGALTGLGIVYATEIVGFVATGFVGDKLALSAQLCQIMMPILALVSVGAVWMGMLNAQRRFVAPALAPAVFNAVSLSAGLVVWLVSGSSRQGIMIWAAGTVVAGLVQAAMQLLVLWRMGYRPRLRFGKLFSHPGVRRIGRLMAPAVVGLAAIQVNVIVNTGFASDLGDGAVSQLNYAFRLFFLPLGVFGVAIGTVTTTAVSEAAAEDDHQELARRAADAVSVGWMLTTASAVGLAVLAEPIVWVIYRHGETTAADAASIAWVLQSYVVGLVPYSLIKILAPSFYSLDKPRIPLVASACGVAANIAFNALTYRMLGAGGIALGTAVGAVVNVTILRVMFGRAIAPMQVEHWPRRLAGLLASNAVMGGVVWAAWSVLKHGIEVLGPLSNLLETVVLGSAVALLIGVGFGVYALTLRATRYPAAEVLLALPKRFVGRISRR